MKFGVNRTKSALGEVQSTLHWSVLIKKASKVAGEMSEDLQIRVTTTGVPKEVVEDIQVEMQGHKVNYTGKVTKNGEITWTFVEGTDAAVFDYFTKWINGRWSGDGKDTMGKQALTADVKADLEIQLLGPDDEVTQTYTLIGCMPQYDQGAELSQSADAVNPTITWTYDDFHRGVGKSTTW